MKKNKKCPKCGKIKILTDFHRNKKTKDGLCCWCKLCNNETATNYRLANPDRVKTYRKKWYYGGGGEYKKWEYCIKKKFGIDGKHYKEILKSQNYNCAICGKSQKSKKKRFAVDHNHQTGFIRGLLCDWCNWYLLRFLRDNKKFAIGITNYLSKALKADKKWKEKV